MSNTENLELPYIDAAQAQKHVTHNEALRALDVLVQLSVKSQTQQSEPQVLEAGDRFIVPTGGTGLFASHDHEIASFADDAWTFYAPEPGWRAYVEDEAALTVWDGAAWAAIGGAGGVSFDDIETLGVNATANTANRLAVKSDSVLFSHDDDAGGGDVRLTLNKAATAGTASAVFQNGFSGRAEIGLAGNDNLAVKVSSDGQTWKNSMTVDRATGGVSVPFFDSQQIIVGFEQVGIIQPPSAGGILFLSIVSPIFPQNPTASLFAYDVGGSPLLTSMFIGTSVVNLGTSNPTGTTSPSGMVGVSVNGNGELKIENRYIGNASRQFCLTFINSFRAL